MNTEITVTKKEKAWVFYDGDCPICRSLVARWEPQLKGHGFGFAPQQEEFAGKILNLAPGQVLPEIKVRTAEGVMLGGADAVLHAAQFIGWMKPMVFLARLPGVIQLVRGFYHYFAKRRYCGTGTCKTPPL